MGSPLKKVKREKHDDGETIDRLSELPDCVLLHILSLLKTKHAVQTCILSTRWKNLWKRLSNLIVSSSQFKNLKCFIKFVGQFLSLRDESTILHDFKFQCLSDWECGMHKKSQIRTFKYVVSHNIERIFEYVVSHNVKGLHIDIQCDINYFPPSFFSCHTLTSLNLSFSDSQETLFPNSLNFPALTNLSLHYLAFRAGDDGRVKPFTLFNRLNSLTLRYCKVLGKQNICISSVTLANLIIEYCNFELNTPNLCNFVYKGIPLVKQLCGSKNNLCSVKHVNIDIDDRSLKKSAQTSLILHNWLVELANIESLTICSHTLEILYYVRDKLKVEFLLCNLKSLKVKTDRSSIHDGILEFFLQNSPSAKVELIRRLRELNLSM
ncbi:F-box/RNI/FBD-like domain protein [Medicago truncatula]|uniref:F-box/RNI/FBD-like domain protein n=1 Tax=Medicago truncatula TaxID=3880 RepID=A0A072U8E4_MEDTR|nr:F-box/RNI/FBD-like domain protein [Medicago truncatula]